MRFSVYILDQTFEGDSGGFRGGVWGNPAPRVFFLLKLILCGHNVAIMAQQARPIFSD